LPEHPRGQKVQRSDCYTSTRHERRAREPCPGVCSAVGRAHRFGVRHAPGLSEQCPQCLAFRAATSGPEGGTPRPRWGVPDLPDHIHRSCRLSVCTAHSGPPRRHPPADVLREGVCGHSAPGAGPGAEHRARCRDAQELAACTDRQAMNALVDRRHQQWRRQPHRVAVIQPPVQVLPSPGVGQRVKCLTTVHATISRRAVALRHESALAGHSITRNTVSVAPPQRRRRRSPAGCCTWRVARMAQWRLQ